MPWTKTMTNGWTPPRLLVQRVRLWQRRLQLDGWDIQIEYAPLKLRHAQSSWPDHTQHATMTFNSNSGAYPTWTDEFLNFIVVHEMYHLLTARVDDTLGDHLGREGKVYKAFAQADEMAADAFATAFTNAYRRKRS
jgi:hypothetical protein